MASATQLSAIHDDRVARRVRGVLIIWSVIAVAITVTSLYAQVPPLAVQLTIASLTLAQVLCFAFIRGFRGWALQICMKRLVLFQSWRILPGLAFLYFYYSLGKFTFDF